MRLQVVERYRRVLSAYYVDVFGWNLPGERIVCTGLYINSKTITLTWLTPEIHERHLVAPPQKHQHFTFFFFCISKDHRITEEKRKLIK